MRYATRQRLATTLYSLVASSGALQLPRVAGANLRAGHDVRMMATSAALPKIETGVAELLQATPEADGRGTLIAVLDTGCDLTANGLLTTSDGKPKYVDFLDCTGGGDVDTSKTATRSDDGTIKGLSGRTLQLGAWADGADEIRLGVVRLFHLLPGSVERRVKAERKTAFAALQHAAVTEAQRELAATPPGTARKEAEARLEHLNKLMDSYDDAGPLLDVVVVGSGDAWKVVVAGDEAASAAGQVDLSEAVAMAPYRVARDVGELGYGTALAYAVQVYEGGALTSLVVDAGSHGTHVAGIAAAHFGEESPDRNGVAPGAQVLALKIGDGRLGSAETGTGLVRALIAAKAAGVDVINLSYGEPFWQVDAGRTSATFSDAVRKWNMAVFTSAGNDGPALSSLGSPGCLSAPITVGAYISPAMMADQYSMLPPEADGAPAATSYSFSSRGPTPDGWLPTLCAPGGAVAPVPRHTLQGTAQYHGTSMSSPNACGVAACVLSALKQNGVHVGPIALRRALENTAKPVETSDPYAQGHGLINAPAAVAYALAHHGKLCQDVEMSVSVPSRANARGLYLRDAAELSGPNTFGVHVTPLFEHAFVRSADELASLLAIELPLTLSASAPWISTPASMILTSGKERGGQSFAVKVDASGLAPGAHFARVLAHDASDPARGPLFSLPVTVIVPHALAPPQPIHQLLAASSTGDDADGPEAADGPPLRLGMHLPAGRPVRKFLAVPETAEFATVRILSGAMPEGPHSVILHAVPSARGDVPNTALQVKKFLTLREHAEESVTLPTLKGGATLELCMQLSWLANPSPVDLDVDVQWHSYGFKGGAVKSDRPLRIGGASTYARLEVGAPLRSEKLHPKAELTTVERSVRPAKHNISAASAELDYLPPSDAQLAADASAVGTQLHRMVLSYKFDVAPEKADESLSVVPRLAALHEQLYDAPLDSALWRLADSHGKVVGHGGLIHDSKALKLRKGSYSLELLVRHPSPAQLEALKDLPLQLRIALPKGAACKVFGSRGAATAQGFGESGKPLGEGWMRRGAHRNLYVAAPTGGLPSWVVPGDALVGELQMDQAAEKASAVPLVYEVPPAPAKKADDTPDDKDDKDDAEGTGETGDAEAKAVEEDAKALSKALLEAKLARLTSLRKEKASTARYDALADSLLEEHRDHLPLLLELLAWQRHCADASSSDADDDAKDADAAAKSIGAACDALLAPDGPIDPAALAQFFGVAADDGVDASKEAKKLKKDMEEQRSALRLALYSKATSLAPAGAPVVGGAPAATDAKKAAEDTPFVAAVKEMKKWVAKPEDLEEAERDSLALTLAKYELAHGRGGAALAALQARHKAQPSKKLADECVALYEALGWEHWVHNARERRDRDYPSEGLPL